MRSTPNSPRPHQTSGPRPTRTVVLGGTGFAGRHFSTALAEAGHELVVVARTRPERALPGRFVSFDLVERDPGDLTDLLRELAPDVVVNATGAVWAPTPEQLQSCNINLVNNVVAALSMLTPVPRLVHLGSVNEYAPVAWGTSLTEDTPTEPPTPYGRSKLTGTETVLAAMRGGTLHGIVLRIANMVGAGTPEAGLVGKVVSQIDAAAREDRPAVVRLTPMRAHRDFVDAHDAARAVVSAAESEVTTRVVNIGSGTATAVRDLVTLIVKTSGHPTEVVEVDPPAGRPVPEAEWSQVDVAEAAGVLGWVPRRGPEDALQDVWNDLRSHRPDPR